MVYLIRGFIFILFFHFCYPCIGQDIYLSGSILDSESNEPISYVNLSVISKFIGTVSNEDGRFSINSSNIISSDSILISKLGYKSLIFSFLDFSNLVHDEGYFFLEPVSFELREVLVESSSLSDFRTFGNLKTSSKFAYAFNPINSNSLDNLGREICVFFDLRNRMFSLDEIKFVVGNTNFEDVSFKLNFYLYDSLNGEMPGLKHKERIVSLNDFESDIVSASFAECDLIFKDSFWVGVEFIDFSIKKESGILTMPVKFPFGKYLYRNSSLSSWKVGKGTPSIQISGYY